jgi:hypothetical protein
MFRPALVFTQPSIQWVPGFFPAVKWPVCELNHSPPSSAGLRWMELYLYPPICLHGMDREDVTFLVRVVWPSSVAWHWLQKFLFCSLYMGKVRFPMLNWHHTRSDVLEHGSRTLISTFGIRWRCVRCIAYPIHSFGIIFSLCEWMGPNCWDVYRSNWFNQ